MSESNTSPESNKSPEQIERERLTRRQALRKFGFGAGLSTFLLLGVDDLARMVGAKMQQMAGDNQVANQIAKEFQSAGIALASGPSGCHNGPSGGTCTGCDGMEAIDNCCQKSPDPDQCCVNVGYAQPPSAQYQFQYNTCASCCTAMHSVDQQKRDACIKNCPPLL